MRKLTFALAVAVAGFLPLLVAPSPQVVQAAATPIRHIVIVDQENHSFDNVLGKFCYQASNGTLDPPRAGLARGCDGTTSGTFHDGSTLSPLPHANDYVPEVPHSVSAHNIAIDGGAMDGFDRLKHCGSGTTPSYQCYSQFYPADSPNLTALASNFAVDDRFFEFRWFSSWMSHTTLAALDMDGFYGNIPKSGTKSNKGGWGCDSGLQAKWSTTGNPPYVLVPSCVPDQQGNLGPTWDPYSGKTAPYVPTLMDRMQSAGVSWKIYGSGGPSGGGAYGWAICPTFWKCLDPQGSQYPNFTRAAQFINDAKSGDLPQVSIVTPIGYNSQHGTTSWLTGDNWMGSLIDAMTTPNATDGTGGAWSHSTVFISWDDFGGFYDHVAPTNKLGIRLPMVIAGPYVRAGFTVGTNNSISGDEATTWANLAAYVEATFPAVAPINGQDNGAYDLSDAFDYSQTPLPAPAMVTSAIPARSQRLIAAHPFHAENEVT